MSCWPRRLEMIVSGLPTHGPCPPYYEFLGLSRGATSCLDLSPEVLYRVREAIDSKLSGEAGNDGSEGYIGSAIRTSWYLAALGVCTGSPDLPAAISQAANALTDLEWKKLYNLEADAVRHCNSLRQLFRLSFNYKANKACQLPFMIAAISLESLWNSLVFPTNPLPDTWFSAHEDIKPCKEIFRCELELVAILLHTSNSREAKQLLSAALERFVYHLSCLACQLSGSYWQLETDAAFSIGEIPMRLLSLTDPSSPRDWILPAISRIKNELDSPLESGQDFERLGWSLYLELISASSPQGSKNFDWSARNWRSFPILKGDKKQSMTAYLQLILAVHSLRDAHQDQQFLSEAYSALGQLSFAKSCIIWVEDVSRQRDLMHALNVVLSGVEQLVDYDPLLYYPEECRRIKEEQQMLKRELIRLKGGYDPCGASLWAHGRLSDSVDLWLRGYVGSRVLS